MVRTPARGVGRQNDGGGSDPVEVYCRLRPQFGKENEEDPADALVIDETRLKLIPPLSRLGLVKEVEAVFSHVFDATAQQASVFDHAALQMVDDVIHGRNGLLFTYGVTGSGKTYTMTGNPKEIGLLPRCLDVIFNSVGELLTGKYVFQPDGYNGFNLQTEAMAELDRCTQGALLPPPSSSKFGGSNPALASTQASSSTPGSNGQSKKPALKKARSGSDEDEMEWELKPRATDTSRVHCIEEDNAYAVFVSYIEIYNNYIFDLLDSNVDTKKGPQSKGLREDYNRNMFVHGVTEVEVKTTDEAFDVFARGQKLRRVAHTALNTESSRSHSVFNIRLVQAPLDENGREPIQDKGKIHISQLALVDLAGSERSSRTKHTGERIKETGHINSSLMTLRQCIEQLRENQKCSVPKMVPYRDSRLTHLFKNYFDGEGKVRMVVCMNPAAHDYDENLYVIQFAEMTQEVEVVRGAAAPLFTDDADGLAVGRRRAAKFIEHFNQQQHTAATPAVTGGGDMPSAQQMPFSSTPKLILADGFFTQMPSVEIKGPTDEESLKVLKRFFEDRRRKRTAFQSDTQRKQEAFEAMLRGQVFEWDATRAKNTELSRVYEESKEEKVRLERKTKSLQIQVTALNQKLQKYDTDSKSLQSQEDEFRRKQRDMELRVNMKDAKIRQVREIFEQRTIVSGLPSATVISVAPRQPPSTVTRSTQPTTTTTLPPPRGRLAARVATPGAPRMLRRVASPGPPVAPKPPAHVNSKFHRRSKSSGGVVLDHQPLNKIPPGQLMQPNLHGIRKLTTQTPDHHDLRKATDYVLTHQETEPKTGNLKMSVVKGDVLPTSGGGRAVLFRDVEQVTHRAPTKRNSDDDVSGSSTGSSKRRK